MGGCWLGLKLWEELHSDRFWAERLEPSRKGTRWDQVLLVLVAYRLIAPGAEWHLHREWYERSALSDLLGADAALADIHTLYRCHDRLLAHKQAVFDHLVGRWRDLFNVSFDVLLYDLTSTYFEANPPFPEGDKRRYGYSRDRRSVNGHHDHRHHHRRHGLVGAEQRLGGGEVRRVATRLRATTNLT